VKIFVLIVIGILLTSCSDDLISVSDTTWRCEKVSTLEKDCIVEFILINKSEVTTQVNYKIRAHKRVHIADGAISNRVVFNKLFQQKISPNEKKTIREKVHIMDGFWQIVVSAWKDED